MGDLEEAFKLLNQGWVGSLIALLGLLLAFLFYQKSRMRPVLVYQRRALRLIGAKEHTFPEEVQILFKGELVPRLTASYFVIWNAGSATVRGSDIVAADPMQFVFDSDTKVLRVRVIGTTRAVIAFCADVNATMPNEAVLGFDYLDAGDGASIEILHTGQQVYPWLTGTIRGIPSGIRDWGPIPSYAPELPKRARNVLLWAVVAAAGASFWLLFDLPLPAPPASTLLYAGVGLVLGLWGQMFIPRLLVALRRRFPPMLSAGELE